HAEPGSGWRRRGRQSSVTAAKGREAARRLPGRARETCVGQIRPAFLPRPPTFVSDASPSPRATSPPRLSPRAQRIAVAGAFLLALAVAVLLVRRGNGEGGGVRASPRIPPPDPVPEDATLEIDGALAWIGQVGRLTALDSTGRVGAR